MSSAASTPHSSSIGTRSTASGSDRALGAGEVAWLAAVPTAIVIVAAILLVGPGLGRALIPAYDGTLWPSWAPFFHPEPAEQGRFLVSLMAPLLLSGLTVAGVRRGLPWSPRAAATAATADQAGGLAFVAVCLIAQREIVYGAAYTFDEQISFPRSYFTLTSYAVAAGIAAAAVTVARTAAARERFRASVSDTPGRAVTAAAIAVAATAIWLLHAIYTDDTIGTANFEVAFHLQFTMDETFAVLNGLSPLVDFVAQYGSLWPYAFAGGMSLLGDSLDVWVALAVTVTAAAMLTMYAVLRRAARSSLGGLLLFLPFLATSFFRMEGPLEDRITYGNYFGTFPLRYGGPFLLAWLLARHLDGARPRQPWLLFLAAGLVALNNTDVGLPALGATLAALLWAGDRPSMASLSRLALALVAGLAAAFALVSLLTLARTGSLPDVGLLFRYARVFAAAGFFMMPIPALGLHLVIYLTFVATVGVATVRSIAREPDRLLTGMLAWIGVFGLGASAYYVGRSHPAALIATFSTWAFALALLVIVSLRSLAGDERRSRLPLAEVACVFAFAVAACSLAQTPMPWTQLDRLGQMSEPRLAEPYGQSFVERHTRPGEPVVILMLLGHRIGFNLDVADVAPYTGSLSMPTAEQLHETIDALREAGGRKIFLTPEDTRPDVLQELANAGFQPRAQDDQSYAAMWLDTMPSG